MLDGGWWPRSPLWRAGTSRYSPRAAIGGPAGEGGAYTYTSRMIHLKGIMIIDILSTLCIFTFCHILCLVDTF